MAVGPDTCKLAKFKLPGRRIFVPELSSKTTGKVQKNVLREANKKINL